MTSYSLTVQVYLSLLVTQKKGKEDCCCWSYRQKDECGNEDSCVYSLFFWNSEDKYKSGLPLNLEPNKGHISRKMSHKEELVKKCSLESHKTPQNKQKINVEMKTGVYISYWAWIPFT